MTQDLNLKGLREAAEAATQEEWKMIPSAPEGGGSLGLRVRSGYQGFFNTSRANGELEAEVRANAALIERCNPPTILALLDHQERTERELKAARTLSDEHFATILSLQSSPAGAAVPDTHVVVPKEPTEEMWGGLARDIIMAWRFNNWTPKKMADFMESTGHEVPDWLRAEPEMGNDEHTISKGTCAVLLYKAMLAAAPPAPSAPAVQPKKPDFSKFATLEEYQAAMRVYEGAAPVAQQVPVAWSYECRQPFTSPVVWAEFIGRAEPRDTTLVRNVQPLYAAAPLQQAEGAKEVAESVAAEVLMHIDSMYPAMWGPVAKTARTSIRNTIINQSQRFIRAIAASKGATDAAE